MNAPSHLPTTNSPFCTWYLDETIPGHLPLIPSIFVGKTFQWLFSSIEKQGCEAALEVTLRIVVAIILPIIAVIALVFIPIGLISKSIGSCCQNGQEDHTFSVRSGGRIDINSENSSPKYSPRELGFVKQVQKTLNNITEKLGNMTSKTLDIKKISEAETILSKNEEDILALQQITVIDDSQEDPVIDALNNLHFLQAKLTSLAFLFHYDSHKLKEDIISVPDNGDCLFEAFLIHEKMENSTVNDAKYERSAAVEWIRNHYKNDDELQRRLVNSMAEHYQTELEKLEKEFESLADMTKDSSLNLLPQQLEEKRNRLKNELPQEMHNIYLILGKISEAFGEKFKKEIHFKVVEDLVEGYLNAVSNPGIHAGSAELYALSCMYKVPILVYHKDGQVTKPKPYDSINEDTFKKNSPRRFSHSHNHFEPLFPK